MEDDFVDEYLKSLNEYTKKACKTKETARQTLVDIGIYTKWGKLHHNYGGASPEVPKMP